jgi:hypothetical protein
MKIKDWLIPRSRPGIFSILAVLLFVVFFVLSRTIVISQGPKERPSFFSEPVSASLLIMAGLCGVFAFFSGTYAVIRKKERAVPVFICAAIGLFILSFWLGEVISPH